MKISYLLRLTALLLSACLLLLLPGCSGAVLDPADKEADTRTDTPADEIDCVIEFNDTLWTSSDNSAVATRKGSRSVTLVKSGVYRLTGVWAGQIRVSVAKTQSVTLILDNLTVTCADSAAIWVQSADRVYVEVPAGSRAELTDGASYVFETTDGKPDACLYGADDLVFRGSGSLIVHGRYNNGIGCKNDILFESGSVTVDAVKNGVKGKQSVTLRGSAMLTVTNAVDGIKSDSTVAGEGILLLEDNASAVIRCEDDALQAVSSVTVRGNARVQTRCGGQTVNCDGVVTVNEGAFSKLN